MCGITGVWYKRAELNFSDIIGKMNSVIEHRGPDAGGVWVSKDSPGLAFGHRRLSILDLSPEGAQPKESQSTNFVITFNGEIYNFLELRAELESLGSSFRGHSDTEVLLEGFERWGVRSTLERSIGMFAFAVWDKKSQTLTLARDRIGEKPLYYAATDQGFFFGSEIRSLKQCPGSRLSISPEAVAWYFRYGYVPAPLSIYQEAQKLLPGTFIEVRNCGAVVSSPVAYWDATRIYQSGIENPLSGTFSDVAANLDALLTSVIKNQMISDVPLGAFLSGGVDSSTVVAIMQKLSSRPVKTFSIGFEEQGYNEAPFAKEVAHHLRTDHTEAYVSGTDALEVVPRLSSIFDEPFSDSSQIPTFLVSRIAKKHVTVALSGDGGDEAFGGYSRYAVVNKLHNNIRHIPAWMVPFLADLASKNAMFLAKITGQRASRWHKLSQTLRSKGWAGIYDATIITWPDMPFPADGHAPFLFNLRDKSRAIRDISRRDSLAACQLFDIHTYLPDDIMVKVDRAAMAVSLESRAPLLDHRIIEFGAAVPPAFKVRQGSQKAVLKEVLYKYVPRKLVDRPKMGFGIPIGSWLKGPLNTWCQDLFYSKDLPENIGINWHIIRKTWTNSQSDLTSHQYHFWNAAILADWLLKNR